MTQATDTAPWHYFEVPKGRLPVGERRSHYLTMPDGVRLAVDVHLPANQGRRPMPTIVRQTRYYRGVELRWPFYQLGMEWLIDHAAKTRQQFLQHGYAWVDVCARGSGASFGHRPCPWSPKEVSDGARVVDWIVGQPWSDGQVGTTGVSYDGTAAEFLVANGHPAVKAALPQFSLYDVYADVAFPGGVHLVWFTEEWGKYNKLLDAGDLDRAFVSKIQQQVEAYCSYREGLDGRSLWARLVAASRSGLSEPLLKVLMRSLSRGVRRVSGEAAGTLLAAQHEHKTNFNVHEGAMGVDFRDDAGLVPEFPDATIDEFSPHRRMDSVKASGVPVYGYSGWFDGAYQNSAMKRFGDLDSSQATLIVGPWDHGGMQQVSSYCDNNSSGFNHVEEMIRFFDVHLRGRDDDRPAVRYFTMGEERWKEASSWPPPRSEFRKLFLSAERSMLQDCPSQRRLVQHRVDNRFGTGPRSRWNSLLGLLPPVGYDDQRSKRQETLVFQSPSLREPLEVTGHPRVRLLLGCDKPDAQLFVQLQEEDAAGRVRYVTEGQLRLIHRAAPSSGSTPSFLREDARPLVSGELHEIEVEMLPTSWCFAAGTRIGLSIYGADCDHFVVMPFEPTFSVACGGARPSLLLLPTLRTAPNSD